ncbi:MAG: DUF4350 domain-containing protein [Erythrobacter sp.]|nr:MAG: DUF4350 domain-containing protein [Erythrobacter sp.]
MSKAGNPFRPGMVLAVLAVGALAFLLMLYAIGQGWTGDEERNGGEHAGSTSLNGFAALARLVEDSGYSVELSRSRGSHDDYGLLVLTPPLFGDPEELTTIIEDRRTNGYGPTLVVLPKWVAMPVPPQLQEESEAEDGWVYLTDVNSPFWFNGLEFAEGGGLAIGATKGWNGLGISGPLPDPARVQALADQPDLEMYPLVLDSEGDVLAAEVNAAWAGSDYDYEPWPTLVVFEPDLMNNYGMADEDRARLALSLVETMMEGDEAMPVIFDLTLAGLGTSENLLTLAFTPPFLAATLCLLLAALVIGWRAFRRFGPPVAEAEAMARGKRQLARNGAALVARVKRFNLLADPYAALMGKRIGDALGVRDVQPEARAAAIDAALIRRGYEGAGFTERATILRSATRPRDIIRAAGALKSIERTLKS